MKKISLINIFMIIYFPTLWASETMHFSPVHITYHKDNSHSENIHIAPLTHVEFSIKGIADQKSVAIYFDQAIVYEKNQSHQSVSFKTDKKGKYSVTVEVCDINNNCYKKKQGDIILFSTSGDGYPQLKRNDKRKNILPTSNHNVILGYLNEWDIYARNYDVTKIPIEQLTHVVFSPAAICAPHSRLAHYSPSTKKRLDIACNNENNFNLVIIDSWATYTKKLAGITESLPVKGLFGQLMSLKQTYPNKKIILSIGGWELSEPLALLNNPTYRERFVSSVMLFLSNWSFLDGIDIQWIRPSNTFMQTHNLTKDSLNSAFHLLTSDLRSAFDKNQSKEYELIASIETSKKQLNYMDYSVNDDVDYFMLRSFDFHGPWEHRIAHASSLYEFANAKEKNKLNRPIAKDYVDYGVKKLIENGVDTKKMILGLPAYGRCWRMPTQDQASVSNKTSSMKLPATELNGIYESGRIEYKALADHIDAKEIKPLINKKIKAAYATNYKRGIFISYDSPYTARTKSDYAHELNLAGIGLISMSGDNGDLINAISETNNTQNTIHKSCFFSYYFKYLSNIKNILIFDFLKK